MNHDSSQSNSISCVRGGSVGITEVFVACDYPRAAVVEGALFSLPPSLPRFLTHSSSIHRHFPFPLPLPSPLVYTSPLYWRPRPVYAESRGQDFCLGMVLQIVKITG